MVTREKFTKQVSLVAIPSYSEVLFLPDEEDERLRALASQSLLIQRSYSYDWDAVNHVGVGSRNPFLFRGPIPTRTMGRVRPEIY